MTPAEKYGALSPAERTALEADLMGAMNKEIARELLLEKNPVITDEEIDKVWVMCKGNPWDAPILYALLQLGGSNAHS